MVLSKYLTGKLYLLRDLMSLLWPQGSWNCKFFFGQKFIFCASL